MKKYKHYYFPIVLFLAFAPFSACLAEDSRLHSSSFQTLTSAIPDSLDLRIRETSFSLPETEIVKWIKEETRLEYNPQYCSEAEKADNCQKEEALLCHSLSSLQKKWHIQKQSSFYLDKDLLDGFLERLAAKANKDPENAKLKMENGKVSVFSLGQKGLELDQEKSKEAFIAYLENPSQENSLELPYIEKDPDLNIDSIDNMGVTELIGEGRSNFRGSPSNRVFNIKVALKRFNGLLIRPGEEFSFTKSLGEVDGEHGYLPELVIKKDKTEPEFGGGICQVSTTVFRAAINTGLEITARRNHAYPVSYYNPQGMDATVYVPKPDLRFINDTPNYILMESRIEGTELIFDFYGTSDGRKIEIDGPKILERNPDGSMKTTFTQKITDKNGEAVREDVFNSSYDSPSKYPHPGSTSDILTEKPKSWSSKEWRDYKKAHGL